MDEKRGLAINCYFWQNKKFRVYGSWFLFETLPDEPLTINTDNNNKLNYYWNNSHYWLTANGQVQHG